MTDLAQEARTPWSACAAQRAMADAAVRTRPPLQLRVARNADELAALAPHWERLHAQAAVASIFNGWSWQSDWWRLYGRGRQLQVLTASRGDALVGLLPLYVEATRHFGLPVRILRLVGQGGDTHPDDLGPLFAPGQERAAAAELARTMLALPGFDVAQLDDMESRSPFPAALVAAAAQANARHSLERSQRIAYARLPADWKKFLASVSGNRRAQIRKKRAKLAAAYPTRFFVWDDAARIDEAGARLAELHRKRWGERSASFASPEYLELHFGAMRAALARDQLRLYCLEIAGAMAAMLYTYRWRKRIFVVQAGFDPQYARWSPGCVLLDHALEHAIGEGNEVFDFLRGEHEYKERIATDERETVRVTVYRPTVGSAAFRARHVYLRRLKAKMRHFAQSVHLL